MKTKVFGIGLSRTGTSSLNAALEVLGYRSIHFPIIMKNNSLESKLKYRLNKWAKEMGSKRPLFSNFWDASGNSLQFVKPNEASFDGMTDLSTTRFYKELDKEFPNSKFILTERDEVQWLQSCERFFAKGNHQFFKWMQVNIDMYGTDSYDESLYRDAYARHEKDVKNYFFNRPNDLLYMNIPAGGGWKKLCPFLGVGIPDTPFPNKNVGKP